MAEVFRARRDGPGGFVKDVALKQILPEYAKNGQLVQRFMEEARIAGALIHGNVVQVYDFGFVDGQYYIAMEYIDGMSLAAVLDRCAETGIPLPSPLVAYIGAEVCAGLAYAHNLTDEAGNDVEVVHRDVSPQNIMLSYAGDVKIGDFGIVKAADSLVRTEAGLRLGKVNYMSPEQASGEKLDGRSDLFALAVTLWEAITLRPLLPRNDPVKTITLLKTCGFPPPSAFQRDVPPELEELVLHGLACVRDDRYHDGEVMARGLRAFVHNAAPGFGRHDLVEYLEWLRPGEGRSSVVGPPVPAVAEVPQRRAPANPRRRRSIFSLLALIMAPLVGLVFGSAAFLGLSLLTSDEPAAVDEASSQPHGAPPPPQHQPPVVSSGTPEVQAPPPEVQAPPPEVQAPPPEVQAPVTPSETPPEAAERSRPRRQSGRRRSSTSQENRKPPDAARSMPSSELGRPLPSPFK